MANNVVSLPDRYPPAGNSVITVGDIAEHLGAQIVGDRAARFLPVRHIGDDSRTLGIGDAYVAIGGGHWHGMDFERDALAAGAALVISDRPSTVLPSIVVDNPRAVVGPLCAWFYGTPAPGLRVFGVTGTNGKTSTAHFIDAGLDAAGETAGLISGARIRGPGFDHVPERTTPEATTLHRTLAHFRREGVTACAMEISSHAVDQHRVDGIAYRAMSFTNLGADHLDYHGTLESYYATKAGMFVPERCEIAVIDIDDDHGRRLAADTPVPSVWTCSTSDPRADVYASDIVCSATDSRFTAHTPRGRVDVRLRTLGSYQVANAVVAMTTLIADGVSLDAAADGLSSLHGIPGRCEPVHAGQLFTALVDYVHNPAGQEALMPYLRSLANGNQIILVIGATGGRDHSKRHTLGHNAGTHADVVIVTDESPEDEDPTTIRAEVLRGAHEAGHARVIEEPDRRTALARAVEVAEPGDVLVVAGRGSDTVQRYGSRTIYFDDHAQLHHAVTSAMSPTTDR